MLELNNRTKARVAYVVSMPHGLDAWTYREIATLKDQGVAVTIYSLKYRFGPYMPKADWYCYRPNKWLVVLRQPFLLLTNPTTYIQLLFEAFATRTLIDFFLAADFAQSMAKRKIDIIHCVFGDHKLFVGYYCKRILGLPLSVALYGYELRANPNWSMFRHAIQQVETVIVNCEYNRDLLEKNAGKQVALRSRIIRHHAEIPTKDDMNKVRVLMVGGFEERKGHKLLLEAVGRLGNDGVNVEVWVVGYPGKVDVRSIVLEKGLENKVRVFGSISDETLAYFYRECHIFCLPSQTDTRGVSEGIPVALIEAMAYGKPVISTRLGGIPELVEEVLVEEGDVDGLADAIKRLANDPELRNCLGQRNLQIVEERYSITNVSAIKDLWLEHLDRKRISPVN